MTGQSKSCPKCYREMEEGFILEQAQSNYVPSVWVEGAPPPGFWKVTEVIGKTKRVVQTYRCKECGYLESYANQEWPPKGAAQ